MIFTPETTQSREEWLAVRQTYLGGTDVAALLGLNPYKSAYDVYAEKVLGERSESSRKAQAGTALEPLVRQWYSEELEVTISEAGTMRHPEHQFLAANIDGYIPNVCVWECKTFDFSTASKWGEPNTDEVPPHYWAQAQWYTGFTGLPYAVIVALDRGTMDYTCYKVDHDPGRVRWNCPDVINGMPVYNEDELEDTFHRPNDGTSITDKIRAAIQKPAPEVPKEQTPDAFDGSDLAEYVDVDADGVLIDD